ncbi:hypothetical protein IEQ34_018345 [Dendrobium chrysotoxum]|uniref:Pollen Ole e 1 allergen and extensin family protein n=1 Tax=Dendrobium chrysotoxum TaxID=161865 RepID=A0AAV7GC25_DENCH|nr:hypothetical protein IEQ34_018345 [Dendrobium chrysotoxum]
MAKRSFLLSLLFAYLLQFSIGSLLKGSVTCIDCSPSYDLSGVRLAVNCSKEEKLSYALTNAKGQFQISIAKPSPLPSDCSVNLLGGKTQLCGFRKSIISKIIAINPLNTSTNSSYTVRTPLAFFTSCKKIIEEAKVEKGNGANYGGQAALGEDNSPKTMASQQAELPPPEETYWLPPLIYVIPFFPIIGIP